MSISTTQRLNELRGHVGRVQARIHVQSFLRTTTRCLAIFLTVAAVAIGLGKVWSSGIDGRAWAGMWVLGAVGVALLAAALRTWWKRCTLVEAAMEMDRRFHLRERLTSAIALGPEQMDTAVGRALVADAMQHVARIDVREKFQLAPGRWGWLPIVMTGIVGFLAWLPDPNKTDLAPTPVLAPTAQGLRNSTMRLKEQLAQQRKELEQAGLNDASALIKELERSVDEISDKPAANKQQALVRLNDLSQALKIRRESLRDSGELSKQLQQLKDLKVQEGPAAKLTQAIKSGDFRDATEQVNKLQQQLREGQLDPKSQQQVAEQLTQMQQKLSDAAQSHQQAKQELQQQIEQQRQQRNESAARQLESRRARLQDQDQMMPAMQLMADQLQQAVQSLQQSDPESAEDALRQLSSQLQQLDQQLQSLATMDEMLNQLANAKQAMVCEACQGVGCSLCQGGGQGRDGNGRNGRGQGQGQGQGDRAEESGNTNSDDSGVSAKPKTGDMVVVGDVRGENKPGDVRLRIREAMEASTASKENPLVNLRLPRTQREQAQQYFDAVREQQ